jgi:hypothetical protein
MRGSSSVARCARLAVADARTYAARGGTGRGGARTYSSLDAGARVPGYRRDTCRYIVGSSGRFFPLLPVVPW